MTPTQNSSDQIGYDCPCSIKPSLFISSRNQTEQ